MKKPKVGLETELFTLDSEGNIINKADALLEDSGKDKLIKKLVRSEVGLSMFEMGSDPDVNVSNLSMNFLEDLDHLLDIAGKNDALLLPLGCYPAKFKPKMRKKEWYRYQIYLMGKDRFPYTMKVCGFHFHYSLPKGLVEKKTESIKRLTHSGIKDIFLNIYNLSVAAEPACMTFCQSSPFIDGKHYGKDCRTLTNRDLSIPDEFYGFYHGLSIFGALPHYEFTLEDLRDLSSRRKNLYLDFCRKSNLKINEIAVDSDLKFMWGPIRVNKIGTLEYRGFDMNYPSYLFSVAFLIEAAMKGIEKNSLQCVPSDIGINEPFKVENEIVYLPPFSMVKSIELLSSRYGFENSAVYNYCSKFHDFVISLSDKKTYKKLKLIKQMLDKKKTLSDKILDLVKKNEYDPKDVPEDFLKYIALYHAKNFRKEIESTRKLFS